MFRQCPRNPFFSGRRSTMNSGSPPKQAVPSSENDGGATRDEKKNSSVRFAGEGTNQNPPTTPFSKGAGVSLKASKERMKTPHPSKAVTHNDGSIDLSSPHVARNEDARDVRRLLDEEARDNRPPPTPRPIFSSSTGHLTTPHPSQGATLYDENGEMALFAPSDAAGSNGEFVARSNSANNNNEFGLNVNVEPPSTPGSLSTTSRASTTDSTPSRQGGDNILDPVVWAIQHLTIASQERLARARALREQGKLSLRGAEAMLADAKQATIDNEMARSIFSCARGNCSTSDESTSP